MHFTREPIIQTVITPKDGCKLVVRSSKGGGQEDYLVDAVEVVSFGDALFFRSLEKPKSFLVPVSDYEILELKETRMVLKNVGLDKSIKIGGGKDTSKSKEEETDKSPERKRERRRSRRRKSSNSSAETKDAKEKPKTEEKTDASSEKEETNPQEEASASVEQEKVEQTPQEKKEEAKVSTSFLSKLFPPPATLIKEKYKKEEAPEKADDPEEIAPKSEESEKKPEYVPQEEPLTKEEPKETSEE